MEEIFKIMCSSKENGTTLFQVSGVSDEKLLITAFGTLMCTHKQMKDIILYAYINRKAIGSASLIDYGEAKESLSDFLKKNFDVDMRMEDDD